MMYRGALAIVVSALSVAPLFAIRLMAAPQDASSATTKPAATVKARSYTTPRTPWGDPALAGVYTNDDETGIPFERPAQFEGRRIEDISDAELQELNNQRNVQFNAGVAGEEFAGGLRPP